MDGVLLEAGSGGGREARDPEALPYLLPSRLSPSSRQEETIAGRWSFAGEAAHRGRVKSVTGGAEKK
jgi:hypothetical protein